MSEHEIIILLRDPQQQPTADIIAATKAFIAGLFPAAEHIDVTCTDEVRYYDCGGNFEHIHCPFCQTELSVEQWHSLMEADYNTEHNSFAMQSLALPCCGKLCNLNQLQYSFEQGFGRTRWAAFALFPVPNGFERNADATGKFGLAEAQAPPNPAGAAPRRHGRAGAASRT